MSSSRLRTLGAVSATVLLGGLFAPVATAAPVTPAPQGTQNVTLFGINDFHGRLASTGQDLACVLETEREEPSYGTTAFLSAGDNIGGSEFESMILNEEPTIAYLNALGLDASAVGNHEFDQGMDTLNARIAGEGDHVQPEFPYLGANVEGSGLDASYVIDRDGVKIAVVGAVTAETASLVSPGGIADLTFNDQVDAVEAEIDRLEAADPEIDVFVASYHDGSSDSAEIGVNPGGTESFDRMAATDGADVVFNAHSHRTYAFENDNGVPVVQAGSYGEYLSAVTVNVDAEGTVSLVGSQLIDTEDAAAEGCATATEAYTNATEIIDQAIADAAGPGAQVMGSQADDITSAFDSTRAAYVDGVWTYTGSGAPEKGDDRLSDSALGTLIADSMVWNTTQEGFSGSEAAIGVINPGGIRADLLHAATGDEADGEITYREAANVLPFANSLFTADYTAAQLYEMLEQQWQPDGSSRAFLSLGLSDNITYTYDSDAERGDRVKAVFVDGRLLDDPEETFTVVSSSFLVPDGGDNFAVLAEGANAADSGLTDLQAFTDYLAANQDLAPDYSVAGVEAVFADDTITVRNLDSTALGAPQIQQAILEIDGKQFTADYVLNEETGTYEAVFDNAFSHADWETGDEFPIYALSDPDTGTRVHIGTLPVLSGGDQGGDGQGSDDDGQNDDQGGDDQTDDPKDDGTSGSKDTTKGPKVGLSSETSDDTLL